MTFGESSDTGRPSSGGASSVLNHQPPKAYGKITATGITSAGVPRANLAYSPPVAFLRDIFAQDPAVSMLRAASAAGRLPHALLFAGPEGVGKGTTAEALSALFLCDSPGPDDACGTCTGCTLLAAGTHPDFHRVYRQLARVAKSEAVARDISVDVIRTYLMVPASRSTQLGGGKVFLVEEADAMNIAAQNALLKTLEEPQGRTLIVLLASQPGALLPTIRSRCQPVYFAPIPDEVVAREVLARGIPTPTDEQARDAARLGAGSLGIALRFYNDGLLPIARELEQRLTATLTAKNAGAGDGLPKFLKEAGEQLAQKILERDPQGSKDQATRESLGLLLRMGADTCRRYMRLARTTAGLEKLCYAVDRLTAAQSLLDSNVNVNLALQSLAAELEA